MKFPSQGRPKVVNPSLTSAESMHSPASHESPGSNATGKPPRKEKLTRSFAGCRSCRQRKVKCDETQPQCSNCARLALECDYTRLPRKKFVRRPRTACKTLEYVPSPDSGPNDPHGGVLGKQQLTSLAQSTITTPGSISASAQPHHLDVATLPPYCAAILSPQDYSAIRFFTSIFPLDEDTRPPEYSGPSMTWMLARKSRLVLHMVCAVGGRKWCEMNPHAPDAAERQRRAIEHYGDALVLLLEITRRSDDVTGDELDQVLAAMWLMVLYEVKFKDGCGEGLDVHFAGVASILKGQLKGLREELDFLDSSAEDSKHTTETGEETAKTESLSPISCKFIVWLALYDGGAAMNGFGGVLNKVFAEGLEPQSPLSSVRWRLAILRTLQQKSSRVYFEVWGQAYPTELVANDIRDTQITCMYAECGQLRYLLGMMRPTQQEWNSKESRQVTKMMIADGIRVVAVRYRDIILMVNSLELIGPGEESTPSGEAQFIALARFIVAFYHAIVLCHSRANADGKDMSLGSAQRHSLSQIMSLSLKAYLHSGLTSLMRFAWPLFVAALESDDMLHRIWILDRYEELKIRGENFRRAHDALKLLFRQQRMDERMMTYWELLDRGDVERFIL